MHSTPSTSQSRSIASIIIPTHNRKDLLVDAVKSCFEQTWSEIEIIIIDDGSTDGTEELVRDLLRGAWEKKRISYYRQENAGASAARNAGLKLATGTYVQFLDSDDLLFPKKIELQIQSLECEGKADAVGCSCYGLMGPTLDRTAGNVRIGSFCRSPGEYLTEMSSRAVHVMQTSAPLWRRSFLSSQKGWRPDISLGDDLEYHFRLLSTAKDIVFLEQELFFVREHSGPRLSDAFKDRGRTLSAIRARKSMYDVLQSTQNWDQKNQEAFLGAMKSLYANILQCGDNNDIRELEEWLTDALNRPNKSWSVSGMIFLRKLLGKNALLSVHRMLRSLSMRFGKTA